MRIVQGAGTTGIAGPDARTTGDRRPRRRPSALAVLALVATLALMVAGCSGGDEEAEDASAAATAGAAQSTTTGGGTAGDTSASAGGGSTTPPAADIDACALLTAEEVAAAIDFDAVSAAAETPIPPFYGCIFDAEGGPRVSLTVVVYADPGEAEQSFEDAITINGYAEVEGVGDRAVSTQPLGEITALHGRYEVLVDIFGLSDDNDLELDVAGELAALVISRLP